MLHLYFIHRATLVPDWMWSFSSFNAAGTNECLHLSCRCCPLSGNRILSYRRCSDSWAQRTKDSRAFWVQNSVGWMPDKIKRLSVGVGHRHPVTMGKASLMGLWKRRVWHCDTKPVHSTQPWNGPKQGWLCGVLWHPHPQLNPINRFENPTQDINFLRSYSKCRRNVSALSSFTPR